MYAKIQISGTIEVVTGMHIGGSSAFSPIGAVDSEVMKDARTNLPLLPGSSFKGKMRTLLARRYNENLNQDWDFDDERILRLFGSARKGAVRRGRLLFSDTVLSNAAQLRKVGLDSMTEVKFENNISRTTAVAMPRQIERVVRGAQFPLYMIYDAEKEEEIVEDFQIISEGLNLLMHDYLGGHGSRGYGRIKCSDLKADVVIGEVDGEILRRCRECLNGVAHEQSDL